MGFEVLVGIPSHNEADTIGHVLTQVDAGLREYFPHLRALIVNVDNHSDDGTREAFMGVRTRCERRYVSTEPGVTGKGRNVRNFLALARDLEVRAGAIVDADLQSVSPRWVRNLLAPILDEGYDLTFPVYRRYRYDGSVTSLLCYPVVYGLFASNVRQPIGGEFGFSSSWIAHLSECDYSDATCAYGIDLFITTEAIASRSRICGSPLGIKEHRSRERVTLGGMVENMMATLLQQVERRRALLSGPRLLTSPAALLDTVPDAIPETSLPAIPGDRDALAARFVDGFAEHASLYREALPSAVSELAKMARARQVAIDSQGWCQIVYSLVRLFLDGRAGSARVARALVPLFFGRLASLGEETRWLSDQALEGYLLRQAQTFYERRMEAMATARP
jgi:hypothetical protein